MNTTRFHDKIYGCWLGKNIGGTLGTPMEGQKNPEPLPFEFPKCNEPNDDLDLQLVWLDMLNKKGINLTDKDFADCWINNITYPFDEYGICVANIRRGLMPPQTAVFNNYFKDCMGSPIRSEIWGCICAGMPGTAAYYAKCDAQMDHYDEGVYGEILFACMESIAFYEDDIIKITNAALRYLPESSKVKEAVNLTIESWQRKVPLAELKKELVRRFGVENFTHCVVNIAFTIAGMLYADMDFLKSMVTAVNLGWDTDCTGATAGAIIGIIMGYKAIKAQYNVDFDDRILTGWGVTGITAPANIEEMTQQTIALNSQLKAAAAPPALPEFYALPIPAPASIRIKREFMVSNRFSSASEALPSLQDVSGFIKRTNNADVININTFIVDDKPLYLATTVVLPAPGQYRIIAHANAPVTLWTDGQKTGEESVREFGPSPHRCSKQAFPLRQYDKTEVELLIEIKHQGKASEFALLCADPRNFHVIEAEYRA